MLYLEDYLEMIEHLPQELRDRFTEMRELDLLVQNSMDSLEKRVRHLFGNCQRNDVSPDEANVEFGEIRKGYFRAMEDAEEKVQLANQMYELVERYLRKLDTELYKFKCELEADNKGITEVLEKRSLELDQPTSLGQSSQSSHHKDNRYRVRAEKRRESWGGSASSVSGMGSSRSSELGVVGAGGAASSRGVEGRALVAATAPLALSRTDSAIQAALGRGVAEASSPATYTLGHMGAGNAIAAAATQAIVATQQMQQGRRTASLKASYEAIGGGGAAGGELQLGRELAGAAQQALQAAHQAEPPAPPLLLPQPAPLHLAHQLSHVASSSSSSSNKRHKKKSSYGGASSSSSSSVMLHTQQTLASSVSRSSSPTQNVKNKQSKNHENQKVQCRSVGNVGVSNAAPITSMPLAEEALTDGEWAYDPNEPRYCICNQVSYGDMVACDNEDCSREWFHYPCVGITAPPKGKWYCPQCNTMMRRRGGRKN